MPTQGTQGPTQGPREPTQGPWVGSREPPGAPREPPGSPTQGAPGGPRGAPRAGTYRPLFNPLVHDLPGKGLGPPRAPGPPGPPRDPPPGPLGAHPGDPGPQFWHFFPKNSLIFYVKHRKHEKTLSHGPKSPLNCPFLCLYDIYHIKTHKSGALVDVFFAVKPNIGGVDIGRGDLAARPLGAASPAVFQVRSSSCCKGLLVSMTQAPHTPRGGHPLVRMPPTLPSARRAFPPNDEQI